MSSTVVLNTTITRVPTALDHYQSIPEVIMRLLHQVTIDPNVRYEGFQVDPQYALRPEAAEAHHDPDHLYADHVPGGGSEVMQHPDFIISKPIDTGLGNPCSRHIIAIMEVKRAGASPTAALGQLSDYSYRVEKMPNVHLINGTVPSYLLVGPRYTQLEPLQPCYRPSGRLWRCRTTWEDSFRQLDLTGGTIPLGYSLCKLAVFYWDL